MRILVVLAGVVVTLMILTAVVLFAMWQAQP